MTSEQLRQRIERMRQKRKADTDSAKQQEGFPFCPFSPKQKLALGWWRTQGENCEGIIADGAVRSGKTVAVALGFCLWAMNSFSGQNFAICGRTIGSVRRNVLSLLRRMLPECGCTLEEKRSENVVIIRSGGVQNHFYLFGARDERAQDLIQGMTLAGVLCDEVALMPESFVNQATARCSVQGSKFWFSCNPEGPAHWFKTGWIDRCTQRRLLYLRFTMRDNLSLSPQVRRRYESMYTGVFYRRYVLGRWCAAQGLIYTMFDPERHVHEMSGEFDRTLLSCDYGTNNPFSLGLVRVRGTGEAACFHLEREIYHDGRRDGQMTDGEYADALDDFVRGEEIYGIIVDPSASSFITELRRRGYRVIKARNNVGEGIREMGQAIAEGRLSISGSCTDTLREFSLYCWDTAAQERGEDKPLKQNDHAMDMLRYCICTARRLDAASRAKRTGMSAR